jgi:hypothetical protein
MNQEQVSSHSDEIHTTAIDNPQDCTLEKENQCCCVCRYELIDYEHCTSNRELRDQLGRCICSVVKGWICVNPEIYEGVGGSSKWPHHSIGCELFDRRG